MRLLVATSNPGKLREIRPILARVPIELVTLDDLPPVAAPEETGVTFWENARIKALGYARATGLTTVAEDSGLCVAALDGGPGVQSARFLGPDVRYAARFAAIYARLAAQPAAPRDAWFITALAVARVGEILFETEGRIDGVVAPAPAGTHGFGYDPIFLYPPMGRTTAEMAGEEKAAVSHRARAFRDLARWLRAEGPLSPGGTSVP